MHNKNACAVVVSWEGRAKGERHCLLMTIFIAETRAAAVLNAKANAEFLPFVNKTSVHSSQSLRQQIDFTFLGVPLKTLYHP